jgi:plasmid stabilization system protein ParE
MRRIVWTIEARQEVQSYLAWLRQRSRIAVRHAELDILDMVVAAAKRPNLGRATSFANVRVRSLTKWHKRISYLVTDKEVKILSLQDTRQALQDTRQAQS